VFKIKSDELLNYRVMVEAISEDLQNDEVLEVKI
jgi:hypothetical protein